MGLQCLNPATLQDGDLLAFLDGAAPAYVGAHIAACGACQETLTHLQEMELLFDAALFRHACPSGEELLGYQMALLPRQEHTTIQRHLKQCAHCQEEVVGFDEIAPSPPPFLARLKEKGKQILSGMQLSFPKQPAFALMGDEQQQRLYQAQSYQITVALDSPVAATNLWQLEGQLVNEEDPLMDFKGHVSLRAGDVEIARDQIDEFGYFELENITPGQYDLLIELPDLILSIESSVP